MTRFSRFIMRTQVFFVVLVQRTIGRILAHGKKSPNMKGKIIPRFFAKKFVPHIENMKVLQTRVETPETIWQFWDGSNIPEIAKMSMESVERHKGKLNHKILNLKTMDDYSDLPGYVHDRLKNGVISFIHFADLLRMNVLKNHGGFWMDATNFMTSRLPEYITDEDFFVFLTDKKTYFSYSFMQNFFIRAKKNAFLLCAWHDLCLDYWKEENIKIVDYFAHQLMFKALVENDKTAKAMFEKMPHVSEDQTLQFVGAKQFAPFDGTEWEHIKNTSFFQKLTYKAWTEPSIFQKLSREYWKKKGTRAIVADYPGSFYEKLAKGEIE